VVDGNAVQKKAAELVLRECGLMIPVVAVTKNDKHKPERLVGAKELILNRELDILLANAEAHRFAIAFYRHTERKKALT
jgi:excinuclease UvrABC nuclease subunit